MIDLALAVCCAVIVGILFKVAAVARVDRFVLLSANYFVAAALSAVLSAGSDQSLSVSPELAALAGATGLLFIGSYVLFTLSTEWSGVALTTGVNRVAVLIPFCASWVLWGEAPTVLQLVGLALACTAFFLIVRPDARDGRRTLKAMLALSGVFLAGGLADLSLKTFEAEFAAESPRGLFMLLIFGTALTVGAGLVVARRRRHPIRKHALLLGAFLGVSNLLSVEFLLRALGALPGTFVFPVNNAAVVMSIAVIGAVVWKEQLTGAGWAGIVLAALSVALLGTGLQA